MQTPEFAPGAMWYEATAKHLATLPDNDDGRREYDRLTSAYPDEVKNALAGLTKIFAQQGPDPIQEQAAEDRAALIRYRGQVRARRTVDLEGAEQALAFLGETESLTDAFARPEPEQQWAVKDMLPADGNVVLVAAQKTGKTTMVNHLAKALVDDVPFLGEFPVEPGRVAFFNYEVGGEQWTRWMRDAGIRNTDEVFPVHLRGKFLTLRSEAVRDKFTVWLAEREIDYLILDPGHRACAGYKSEENDEVLEFTEMLDQVKKDAGVKSIIMPLHTGHAAIGRARGAARWGDWPDATWTYEKTKEGGRTLEAIGRDVELAPSMISYDSVRRDLTILGGALTESQREEQTIGDMILTYLERNPDDQPKKGQIGDRIGKGKQAAMQAADRLVGMGRAHYVTGARNAQILRPGPAAVIFVQNHPNGSGSGSEPNLEPNS